MTNTKQAPAPVDFTKFTKIVAGQYAATMANGSEWCVAKREWQNAWSAYSPALAGCAEFTAEDGSEWCWEVTFATAAECREWVRTIGAQR